MQFVPGGPDVPDTLLQAHERGDVVFFAGAGISRGAGLPNFEGLVRGLYKTLEEPPTDLEEFAMCRDRYDIAIGLLEERIVGKRTTVRKKLAQILKPEDTKQSNTAVHEALLDLSVTPAGKTRIVTTNFDRIFERILELRNANPQRFMAPLLPVPKRRWNGLVYLHGLLPDSDDAAAREHLVVSSGDFGLAYLTERWAARFVSELFRNYTVCFVGYSIDDPVVRYMMDALAADKLRGEAPIEMFSFASYGEKSRKVVELEWRSKHVTPILFSEADGYRYLRETLAAWALTYRDGTLGKERIVLELAMSHPSGSTTEDDFVGRLIWALSHPNGQPALKFAEMKPAPSLDWLEELSKPRFRKSDLERFGLTFASVDEKFEFSFLRRPSQSNQAVWMGFSQSAESSGRLDDPMFQMARWTMRHLGDPVLFQWLTRWGGKLNPAYAHLLQTKLDELRDWQVQGNTAKLDEAEASAPNAVPSEHMRTLWDLLLAGRIQAREQFRSLYQWLPRLERDGLTQTNRVELLHALKPFIEVNKPHGFNALLDPDRPKSMSDLVDAQVKLCTFDAEDALSDAKSKETWMQALPQLLSDFTALLLDAFELMRALGEADEWGDSTSTFISSVEGEREHRLQEWILLVDLAKDAWDAADAAQAVAIAGQWWDTPFPVFKRLALYAASKPEIVSPGLAVDWLQRDQGHWLWDYQTNPEVRAALAKMAPQLTAADSARLQEAVLQGPHAGFYLEGADPVAVEEEIARLVWSRLSLLHKHGTTLSAAAVERMATIRAAFPEWADDDGSQEDEAGAHAPVYTARVNPWLKQVELPLSLDALIAHLKEHEALEEGTQDRWRERCREDFRTTSQALETLAQDGRWPVERWQVALQVWSDEPLLQKSWLAPVALLVAAPAATITQLSDSLAWWIRCAGKHAEAPAKMFLALARRVLAIRFEEDGPTSNDVGRAINSAPGRTTQGVLEWWFATPRADGQGLHPEIAALLKSLLDPQTQPTRDGRVIVASGIVSLFRVDPTWTSKHVLPLFDWAGSAEEAQAAWHGMLWSGRLYPQLAQAILPQFIETASHFEQLHDFGRIYASLATFIAVDSSSDRYRTKLAAIFRVLPDDGLVGAADALVRVLSGAGDQAALSWQTRARPMIADVWPKSEAKATAGISEAFALLAIATRDAFSSAVEYLGGWFKPIDHPEHALGALKQSGLASTHPSDAVALTNAVMGTPQHVPPSLVLILDAAVKAQPALATDPRVVRLREYLRVKGS